jgi:hypothetical protein
MDMKNFAKEVEKGKSRFESWSTSWYNWTEFEGVIQNGCQSEELLMKACTYKKQCPPARVDTAKKKCCKA